MTNGTAYTFEVVAANANGTGPASAPTPPTTPATVPHAPVDLEVAAAGDAAATVSWTPGVSDGGTPVTSYRAVSTPHARSCITSSAARSCTITGLEAATTYTFEVIATNDRGDSARSAPSAPFTLHVSDDDGDESSPPGGSPPSGGGTPPGGGVDDGGSVDDGGPAPVTGRDGRTPTLPAGGTSLWADGSNAPAALTATPSTLVVSGSDVSLSLSPRSASGAAAETVLGSTLWVAKGNSLRFGGEGLEPGAPVHVWMFSEPVLLGSTAAGSNGTVAATVPVPGDVADGPHTVQVVTTAADGMPVAWNLGIEVSLPVAFSDVVPSATHGPAIVRLARMGIAGGFPDGSFGPGGDVTRGQMATFLARSLQLEPGSPGAFTDTAGTTHDLAIAAIVEAGIAGGFSDGTFRPNAAVTRGQMATFLASAAALDELPQGLFTDVAGSVHAGRINAAAVAGIAAGFDDGTYRPGEPVTRGQMASLVTRMIDRVAADG